MSELENKELINAITAIANADAIKEMADELERYVESGEAAKAAEEASEPETWYEKLFEKLFG